MKKVITLVSAIIVLIALMGCASAPKNANTFSVLSVFDEEADLIISLQNSNDNFMFEELRNLDSEDELLQNFFDQTTDLYMKMQLSGQENIEAILVGNYSSEVLHSLVQESRDHEILSTNIEGTVYTWFTFDSFSGFIVEDRYIFITEVSIEAMITRYHNLLHNRESFSDDTISLHQTIQNFFDESTFGSVYVKDASTALSEISGTSENAEISYLLVGADSQEDNLDIRILLASSNKDARDDLLEIADFFANEMNLSVKKIGDRYIFLENLVIPLQVIEENF